MFNNFFQKIINYYISKKNKSLYIYFFHFFKYLIKKPVIINFKDYKFFASTNKKELSRWMIKNLCEWDRYKVKKILKLIKLKKACFIDCGCNYGAYSIPVAKKNPQLNTYAFDASKKSLKKLIKNIELNNIKNIKYFNYGIGDKTKTKYFNDNLIDYKNSGSFKFNNNNIGKKVKIFSIDDLIKQKKIKTKKNTIIKLDIEGYEFFALIGMKKLIKKNNVIIFFELSKMLLENHTYLEKKFNNFIKNNNLELYDINFRKQKTSEVFDLLKKLNPRYRTIGDYILSNVNL